VRVSNFSKVSSKTNEHVRFRVGACDSGWLPFVELLLYLFSKSFPSIILFTNASLVCVCVFGRERSLNSQNGPWCIYPGFNNTQEILNVLPDKFNSYYYKMDSRILDNPKVTYYQCTDLFIGAVLNIYSRTIILVRCDRLTEDFYRNVYGLSECNNF